MKDFESDKSLETSTLFQVAENLSAVKPSTFESITKSLETSTLFSPVDNSGISTILRAIESLSTTRRSAFEESFIQEMRRNQATKDEHGLNADTDIGNETPNSEPASEPASEPSKPKREDFDDPRERTSYDRLVYVLAKKAGFDLDSDKDIKKFRTSIHRFAKREKLRAPSRGTLDNILKSIKETRLYDGENN